MDDGQMPLDCRGGEGCWSFELMPPFGAKKYSDGLSPNTWACFCAYAVRYVCLYTSKILAAYETNRFQTAGILSYSLFFSMMVICMVYYRNITMLELSMRSWIIKIEVTRFDNSWYQAKTEFNWRGRSNPGSGWGLEGWMGSKSSGTS